MSLFKKKNISAAHPFCSAVVVAAGNSTRMNGINKQTLLVDGVPVLIMTLKALEECDAVDEIVIAAREQDIPDFYSLVKEYEITKVKTITVGGDTRQQSVKNAVEKVSGESEYLIIHDGARPFVSEEIILNTLSAAEQFGSAAAGVPSKDTVKVVNERGEIVSTPERSTLRLVQTPQIFKKELYLKALNSVENADKFTDDCKLIEAYGGTVVITEGSYDNIKITTPEDIILAQAIIEKRKEND